MKYSVCVIICAAGKGLRTGFQKNKLLVPFGGSCVLQKTLNAFNFPAIDEIVVTSSKEDFAEISQLCSAYPKAKTVLGGDTRSKSVYNALKETKSDVVLIHDGARPFVTQEIIEGCIQSVKAFGSGICAIPCSDTIAESKDGKIVSVPDRNILKQIQTPQNDKRQNDFFVFSRINFVDQNICGNIPQKRKKFVILYRIHFILHSS